MARVELNADAVPRFAPHVQFRFDAKRTQWVILAPERLLVPDAIAVEVLRLCDGQASIFTMVAALAETYQATPETLEGDILELLQDLMDQGVLTL